MNISVVIPLLNEKESLRELTDSILDVMKSYNFSYEVIFIDDGSSDNSWDIIEELSSKSQTIKGIKFQRNYGKSRIHEKISMKITLIKLIIISKY